MTSVDDLFRTTNATQKRKLEDPTASFSRHSVNKSAKLKDHSSPHSSSVTFQDGSSKIGMSGKATSVQDETTGDDDDIEAGPVLPPDDELEDEIGDDEEGRFFGGGVSKQEKEVLDYIEQNEDDGVEEKIDSTWLRRTAINFERKINKNAEMRAKYEEDPMKFVGSEADLDTEIKGLSLLSEHGELYPEFVKMGCTASLVGLLAHENTDIAIAVCELIAELTDEDSATNEPQWNVLVNAMVKSDLLDLLVSNLGRLDEEGNDNDRSGIYHILNVLENLLSHPETVEKIGANSSLLDWLLARTRRQDPDARGKVGQNRQYAGEILAILLQESRKSRTQIANKGGVDAFLELLSAYRKRDPEKDSDEEEFVENLFDCLTCLVEDKVAAEKFLEGEGVELCLIMLREGRLSKQRALTVLDHGMSGGGAVLVCERLVEAVGLKTIFGMLMKSKKAERETVEHIIGILASLLRYLPANSAGRIRTLAKFVEKDYEKITRIMDLRKEYQARLNRVEAEILQERQSLSRDEVKELDDEWLSRRLDAGLFPLQTMDVILTWLIAEDDGAGNRIRKLLPGENTDMLEKSLREQLSGMDDESNQGDSAKDMLEALLKCIERS